MTRLGNNVFMAGLLIGVLPGFAALGQEQPAAVVDCYKAVLSDGKELSGASLDGWKDPQRQPALAGANIFDPKNPVRMLWDVRRKPNLNGPFIEFTNGDVLACQIKQYLPADPGGGLPARLNVELAPPLITYRNAQQLLVRADRVRRIVQTDSPMEEYQLGMIIYKDGRRTRVGSLRMTVDGIQALDADNVITAQYEDLAEVHLSCESPEEGTTGDLTGLCPSPQSLVVRFTTADGTTMTFRHAMMSRGEYYGFPNFRGNIPFAAVQPAWALSAVKVPADLICMISCRQADEMPASLLNVETVSEKSYTGMLMRWRRNCNVRGQMLESGGIISNLGIGVHSFSQVAVKLPKSARSFSCLAGLDRSAGNGGCVEARIYKDQAGGEPVWKSGFLRGGDKPIRVGPIDVAGAKQLILECDYGHNGRPAGAEPFDIRDEFDWILPVVAVDPARLPKPDLPQLFPQIAAWKVEKQPDKMDFSAVWNEQAGQWDTMMTLPAGQPLTISRQITPSKKLGVFELRLARPVAARTWDHTVVLKVNDKPVPEITNLFKANYPRNYYSEGTMGFVPLEPYFGAKTDLNLTIQRDAAAGGDNMGIAIRKLGLTAMGGQEEDEPQEQGTVVPLNSLVRTFSRNGSGEIRKDRNYNNNLIRIHGVAYSTGLSVHPLSVAKFDLGMKYKTFISDIGIDDLTGGNGSAVFEVWADDVKLYESGNVRGGMAAKRVSADVAGRQELKLVVKGGDTGNSGSYACWAGPRLIKDPDAAKRIASGKPSDKVVKAEYYLGAGGVNFGPKDDSSLFENLQPEMAERLKNLQVSDFPSEGNFATLIRCFLIAPQTGEYVFFITSDDSSRLWLSAGEDPAGRKKIAFVDGRSDADAWDAKPGQKSRPVKLEKGKRYYMEVAHLEGGGGAHLAVGWEMPDKTMERPIPLERLESYEPPKASPRTAVKIDFPKAKIVKLHKIGNVKLDGDLAEWRKMPSMPLPFMNKTESSVRLAWREDGLYGSVQAKDDNVKADERNPWVGDCLELWLDKDCSRVADREKPNKAAQYVFAPGANAEGGNGVTAVGWGSPIDVAANLQCAWKKTPDGYEMEFFIPAKVLEPAKMQIGAMMGLNFALDNNGKAVEQFFRDKDVENAYRRPALWGVVELAE